MFFLSFRATHSPKKEKKKTKKRTLISVYLMSLLKLDCCVLVDMLWWHLIILPFLWLISNKWPPWMMRLGRSLSWLSMTIRRRALVRSPWRKGTSSLCSTAPTRQGTGWPGLGTSAPWSMSLGRMEREKRVTLSNSVTLLLSRAIYD